MAEPKEKPRCTNCGKLEPIVKITDLKGKKDDSLFCVKCLNKFCIETLKATLNTKPAPKDEIRLPKESKISNKE